MKYVVNISGTSNISDSPTFFLGTGFLGSEFSSFEELKNLLYEYATFNKDGKQVWRKEIKITFNLASTIDAFKAEGDKQCETQGFVDLFKAARVLRQDPFRDIKIIFRPSSWVDKNGKTFRFVLIKGDEVLPRDCKLSEILKEIGIIIS